jgi:hypothetical protein
VLGGALDRCGDALEGHLQVLDPVDRQVGRQQLAQGTAPVQVGAAPQRGAEPLPDRAGEHAAALGQLLPQPGQAHCRLDGRVGRDEGPVERADRRADDEVGHDPGLEQRPQHPDLAGTEHAAAAQDEGGRRSQPAVGHPLTLPPAPFRTVPGLPTTQEARPDRRERAPVSPSAVLRLCCGAVVLAVTAGTALPAAAAPQVVPVAPVTSAAVVAQVQALDREVTRVSAALTASVTAYEQAQDRLTRLTQDRMAARDAAEASSADAAASRASFDGLARAAYKGGVPPLVTALLSGDPRTVSDLAYVRRSVTALGVERREQAGRAEQRRHAAGLQLARSDADRRSAVVLQQVVDERLAALLAEADRLSTRLAASADALVAARAQEARALAAARAREQAAARAAAARAAAAAGELAPASSSLGPGAVAGRDLRSAEHARRGERLPAGLDAVPAVDRPRAPPAHRRGAGLRAAASGVRLSLGRPLCVTDSYRSYAAQVDVFARKPSLAAVPGTSQHGWGLAVDLCGGVQVFGTEAHEWMRANAPAFGWHHPRWAREDGRKPEAWHWEFGGRLAGHGTGAPDDRR